MKTQISIIVPVFNEQDNLEKLVNQINQNLQEFKKTWELIFVNDGSTDDSQQIINKLQKKHLHIKLISFIRNFGQTAALAAGFDQAQGNILITLDADLQNDPADIPRMLKLMKEEKADIVIGWRKNRQDSFLRTLFSQSANIIINLMMKSDIKDSGCALKLIKKDAVKNLSLYGEMHRLLPFLLTGSGANIIQTPVTHHPRTAGKSKYGFMRTFKVLLDMVTIKFLTSYQTKPMYMFGSAGFGFIFLSITSAIIIIVRKLFFAGIWLSPLLFIMTTFFTVGILCILMGLLAEIQVRSWYEGAGKKSYIIKEKSGWK
jgi:glycosyltransferase involved in cell wall biosynthesis